MINNYKGSNLKDLAAIKKDFAAATFIDKTREAKILNVVRAVESLRESLTFETETSTEALKVSDLRKEADAYSRSAEFHQYQLGKINEFTGVLKSQAHSVACGVKLKGFVVENIVITDDGVFAVDALDYKECGKRPTPCDEYCACGEYQEQLEILYM